MRLASAVIAVLSSSFAHADSVEGHAPPCATVHVIGSSIGVTTFADDTGWFFVGDIPSEHYRIEVEGGSATAGFRQNATGPLTLDNRPCPFVCCLPPPRRTLVIDTTPPRGTLPWHRIDFPNVVQSSPPPRRVHMIDTATTRQGIRVVGDEITSL